MPAQGDALTALSQHMSPGELRETLQRVLRVPPAWDYLCTPQGRRSLADHAPPTPLRPDQVIFLTLGSPEPPPPGVPLPEEQELRLQTLWQQAVEQQLPPQDAGDVALLSLALIRRARQADGIEAVLALVSRQPLAWRAALTCAWTHLPHQEQLLQRFLATRQPATIALAVNALVANFGVPQSAATLAASSTMPRSELVSLLQSLREAELAESLASIANAKSLPDEARSDPLADPIAAATRHLAEGRLEEARQVLDLAWERSLELQARTADLLAELASRVGDQVMEAEARRQALQSQPSSNRRAKLAIVLAERGQPQEALHMLPEEPQSDEERAAASVALALLGDSPSACAHLHAIADRLADLALHSPTLLDSLCGALEHAGDLEHALKVAQARAQATPYREESLIALSEASRKAGGPAEAVEQARLALALSPQSIAARRALAEGLTAAGRYQEALPHWQALASEDATFALRLIECTWKAGQPQQALVAAEALRGDAASGHPELDHLQARILASTGQVDSALQIVERLLALHPDDVNCLLTLAEIQGAAGERDAQGQTLAKAAQVAPHCAEAHFALGCWLKEQGRLTEAAQAIERSLAVEPGCADRLFELGLIQADLGFHDRSRETLRQALKARPASTDIRRALALAHEALGEYSQAVAILGPTPDNATPDDHFLAGRLAARAAVSGSPEHLAAAFRHLETAEQRGFSSPELYLWLGQAHLAAEQGEAALACHKAFLEHAQASSPLRPFALIGLARSSMLLEDFPTALSTLEQARELQPKSSPILVDYARAALGAGLLEQALAAAEEAVALDPDDHEALQLKAQAARGLQRWQESLDALGRRAAILGSPQAWLDYAALADEQEMPEEVRRATAQALLKARRDPRALLPVVESLVSQGQHERARRALRYALARLGTQDPALLRRLATLEEDAGDLDAALDTWSRLAKVCPQQSDALSRSAQILCRLNRRSEAIGALQQALELDPQDASLHVSLARILAENGEALRALGHYVKAAELSPSDADLAAEAARAAAFQGATLTALEILEQALEHNSEHGALLAQLAQYQVSLGHNEAAQASLLKAVDLGETTPKVYALLSLVHISLTDLTQARRALNAGLEAEADDAESLIWLGRAALRLSAWDTTQDLAARALSLDDAAASLESVRLQLHLAIAHWLIAEASHAPRHAPDGRWASPVARARLAEAIDRCKELGAPEDRRQRLTLLVEALFEASPSSDTLRSLDQLAREVQDPAFSLAHALAALRAGRPEEAIAPLHRPSTASHPWAALLLASAHLSEPDPRQALQALDGYDDPVFAPLAAYLRSRAQAALGERDAAIASLNQALAAWQDEPAWHYSLACLYLEHATLDQALPHLQRSTELAPDQAEYMLTLARTYRELGSLSDALTAYTRALSTAPRQAAPWREAAEVASACGQHEQAITWFERASTLEPSDARSLIGAARAASALGRGRLAQERAEAALRLSPHDAQVLVGLGEVLETQGKVDKALEMYDRAMAASPAASLPIRLAKARLLQKSGQTHQALELLASAAQQHDQDDQAWAALAEALEASADHERALQAAERAVQLAPRAAGHRLLLGRLCRHLGQLDRALDQLTQGESLAPRNASFPYEKGMVFEARRDLKRALEAYERALALDPHHADAFLRAGLAHKSLKAYARAAERLEQASALAPNNPDILHQLAAVRALELVHG